MNSHTITSTAVDRYQTEMQAGDLQTAYGIVRQELRNHPQSPEWRERLLDIEARASRARNWAQLVRLAQRVGQHHVAEEATGHARRDDRFVDLAEPRRAEAASRSRKVTRHAHARLVERGGLDPATAESCLEDLASGIRDARGTLRLPVPGLAGRTAVVRDGDIVTVL